MADMFSVLILVCAADVAPRDCGTENAVDVITGPSAPNEIVCARDGQAYVAQTPFVSLGDTYPKILCSRTAIASDQTEAAVAVPQAAASADTTER